MLPSPVGFSPLHPTISDTLPPVSPSSSLFPSSLPTSADIAAFYCDPQYTPRTHPVLTPEASALPTSTSSGIRMLIDVIISGHPARALIDTGATCSAISTSFTTRHTSVPALSPMLCTPLRITVADNRTPCHHLRVPPSHSPPPSRSWPTFAPFLSPTRLTSSSGAISSATTVQPSTSLATPVPPSHSTGGGACLSPFLATNLKAQSL